MDLSSTEVPTEIPTYSLEPGAKELKRAEGTQETADTRTVESGLEKANEQRSGCYGYYPRTRQGQKD